MFVTFNFCSDFHVLESSFFFIAGWYFIVYSSILVIKEPSNILVNKV